MNRTNYKKIISTILTILFFVCLFWFLFGTKYSNHFQRLPLILLGIILIITGIFKIYPILAFLSWRDAFIYRRGGRGAEIIFTITRILSVLLGICCIGSAFQ